MVWAGCVWAEPVRLLLVGPLVSQKGKGSELTYHTLNSVQPGWMTASTYRVVLQLPQDQELEALDDLVVTLGLGFSFMRLNTWGFSPDFGLGMEWGSEEVRFYRNFFMGFQMRQGILWISQGHVGCVTSLGLYESYRLNSELLRADVGGYASLGLRF